MKTFMKFVGGVLVVLVVAAGGFLAWMAPRLHPDVELGTASPDVALTTLDDATLPLSSLRGKVVLLDFWSST